MIWLNASPQISKITDDLVVVTAGVVVTIVVVGEFDVAPPNSVGVVVVIVAVVDVVVVVIAVVLGTDANESNEMIQLDKSTARGVGAREFDGRVVTMPDA